MNWHWELSRMGIAWMYVHEVRSQINFGFWTLPSVCVSSSVFRTQNIELRAFANVHKIVLPRSRWVDCEIICSSARK